MTKVVHLARYGRIPAGKGTQHGSTYCWMPVRADKGYTVTADPAEATCRRCLTKLARATGRQGGHQNQDVALSDKSA